MKRVVFILTISLFSASINAQEHNEAITQIIQNRLTFVAENSDDNTDLSALAEIYWQFAERPIILNSNNIDDLASLQLLTPIVIQNLRQHLYTYGDLLSIYELQAVEGISPEDIIRIQPFVTCSAQNKPFDISNPDQELLYRVSTSNQSKFIPAKEADYFGTPVKQYVRYRFNTQNVQLGINAENDAGESFFTGNNKKGFDHYGGFLSIKNTGAVKQAIIGDYQANFGQGLVLWTGFGFGKSTYTQQVVKIENGIRPYASSQESNFLRGATATIQYGKWQITPLVVNRKAEANIIDTINSQSILSSIESAGLHRTANELTRKHATKLIGHGLNTNYQFKKLRVGITYFNYQYSGIQNTNNELKNFWKPDNIAADVNLATDFLYATGNGVYFGEIALNKTNQLAGIIGTTQAIGKQLNTSLVYRSYPASNISRYKLGFADGATSNETGIYWGTELQISKPFLLSGYIDLYNNRWLDNSNLMAHGKDALLKLEYAKKRRYSTYIMFRHEKTDEPLKTEQAPINAKATKSISRWRLHLNKSINQHLVYESRIELSNASFSNELQQGWLVYQNIKYQTKHWSISMRYTKYNTPNYDTRIYAYEHDVLYAFRTPAYYRSGNSYYLLIKRKFNNGLSTWLRFANNRTNLPLNQIETATTSNNNYAITAQIQWKF